MELVVKQPKDKLPFLGIVFESRYQGEKLNQVEISFDETTLYSLEITPVGDKLDVTLSQDETGFKYTYRDLKYNVEKLKRFLYVNRNEELFNLAHLIQKEDKHIVLHAFNDIRVLYVLKVKEVRMQGEE